jgi:transcriptional regulator with XRE-family HTH domain
VPQRDLVYLAQTIQVRGSTATQDPFFPVTASLQASRELHVFPAELTAARRASGLSQKMLAAKIPLNPSDLSRLEHGSRLLPRKDVVAAVCIALNLDDAAAARLKWAGLHDRLMAALVAEDMSFGAVKIVSACLGAIRVLSEAEAIGLAAYLTDVTRSKTVVSQLTRSGQGGGSDSGPKEGT